MQKVVAIIPARLKSSRFPEKVLADILGKSLIQRTYERACLCNHLDDILIAADDPRIVEHVESFGAKAYLTDVRHPSGSDRIAEVAEKYLPDTEIVVNIQADQPLLNPLVVDKLTQQLIEDPEALCCTPISLSSDIHELSNPAVVKCLVNERGRALYFSRAAIPYAQKQSLKQFYKHIGIYCFRRDFLLTYVRLAPTRLQQIEDLEQLKIIEHGYPLHTIVVEDRSVGVDTPEDVRRVEDLLCESISL